MKISRRQTKECGLITANRRGGPRPGRLCSVWRGGSRGRLRSVQTRALPARWDLIWKGPQSAGDLIWLFPKPAPASFLGKFPS